MSEIQNPLTPLHMTRFIPPLRLLPYLLTPLAFLLCVSADAQPMITARYIDYYPSTLFGREISESLMTTGSAKEITLNISGPTSNVVFGMSLLLEEFTITDREPGTNSYAMTSTGVLTDLRYRFSTSPIQPYVAAQMGFSFSDIASISGGEQEPLNDAGMLIVPSGGVTFVIRKLFMLDLSIRSHHTLGSEIHLDNNLKTIGFNGVGVGIGAGLIF